MQRWAAIAVLVIALAGCAAKESYVVGQYAYVRWNESTSACSNNVCTYGSNSESLVSKVKCGTATSLSWDLKNWIHGSVAIKVTDPAGALLDSSSFSANGHGSKQLNGAAGAWTLDGRTSDANGNLEVRLTCL